MKASFSNSRADLLIDSLVAFELYSPDCMYGTGRPLVLLPTKNAGSKGIGRVRELLLSIDTTEDMVGLSAKFS